MVSFNKESFSERNQFLLSIVIIKYNHSDSEKLLEIKIDNQLNSNTHQNESIEKTYQKVNAITQMQYMLAILSCL